MKLCSIEDCNGEHEAKGYCKKHYENYRIHGNAFHVNEIYPEICSIEGCSNKRLARRYCRNHYEMFRKHGDPLFADKLKQQREINKKKRLSVEERFMQYVEKTNDCWIWVSNNKNHKGYGKFTVNGKVKFAHRFSYELFKGELQGDMYVCHSCDNPSCVNPHHLFLGSHQENVDDMLQKNRQAIGEDVANSKLTWEQVDKIREMYKTGNYMFVELAPLFNVSANNISMICRNKIWKEEERIKRGILI